MKKSLLVCGVLGCACLASQASFVVPSSYTSTPGQGVAVGGSYDYFDDTGRQLTDDVLGVNDWQADLGHGRAYEWVGWKTVEPTLTFQFAQAVTISEVQIGFNRSEMAGIYLPASVLIGGVTFQLSPDAIPNYTRAFVSFTGSWTGSSLSMKLQDSSTYRWMFVDEIRFSGVVVPEPSTLIAGFFALGILGLAAWRNR